MDFIFENLSKAIPFALAMIWIFRTIKTQKKRREEMARSETVRNEPFQEEAAPIAPISPIEENEQISKSVPSEIQEERTFSKMPSEEPSVLGSSLRAKEEEYPVKTNFLSQMEESTPFAQGMLWSIILSPPPSLTPPEDYESHYK